jgi:hypothetical protein
VAGKVTLQLQFLTDQNKKVRINIPNPRQPVDPNAVQQAMDTIVAKNIFALPQGVIVKKVGATLVQTDSSSVVG